MRAQHARVFTLFVIVASMILSACGAIATEVPPTSTPQPTATNTLTPTATFTPTVTPRPTRTPNLAATQQIEEYNAQIQTYFDLGYVQTIEGSHSNYDDFFQEWAQLGWYRRYVLDDVATDFVLSAHLKWSSAYRQANVSGCGFVFAQQENGDHYAVFLDRSEILFLEADQALGYSRRVGKTRGTGKVKFDNPADAPVEADMVLIVTDAYARVLVNGEVVGEYTLSQSKILKGELGLTILSGTNKDFGTRCEMTEVHAWIPK